jgi:lysophospholipase L1-like esterase
MTRFHRYVALGDSTTEGLEDPDGRGGYRGWANRFAEHLAHAFGSIHYANLGVRGLRARDVHATQLTPALDLRPDLATVVAGVNDLLRPGFDADEVAGHIRAMVTALRAQGATVLTFTMPDMARVNPLARLLRGRLAAMNERLRETCRLTGARLLDLAAHDLGGDPRLWDDDRLHANSVGHERIGRGLAHTAGLPGFDDWATPLPPAPERRLHDFVRAELIWSRKYFVPWLVRHARGESSGDGRTAKRPRLEPLLPPAS